MGGTLIRPWPSVGHLYAQVAAWHGHGNISIEALNRQFAAAWGAWDDFNYTRAEWAALVQATFSGLLDQPPSRALFSELYRRFAEPDAWQVFDDVCPCLDALASAGLKLGVISNWDQRLVPLLRRLKLHNYFDAVAVSCQVGYTKPSPVIFRRAASRLRLPPQAILHIGDSFAADVEGARSAGLKAAWLRRGGRANAPGQFASLDELCAWLSRGGDRPAAPNV